MRVTATPHLTSDPRTSPAGRRARSIRAAIFSTPSTTLATTTSRRVRGESSLHVFTPTNSPVAALLGVQRRQDHGPRRKRTAPRPPPSTPGLVARVRAPLGERKSAVAVPL